MADNDPAPRPRLVLQASRHRPPATTRRWRRSPTSAPSSSTTRLMPSQPPDPVYAFPLHPYPTST
eukprot:scaffold1957_cov110-Isochrysis_galbana.AAC.7